MKLFQDMALNKCALQAIVSGRVQLVMYRDFAERKARALRITGTVENMPDGTVRVIAEGEKDALDSYIELLKRGPLLSRVQDVAVSWVKPTGAYTSFSITY